MKDTQTKPLPMVPKSAIKKEKVQTTKKAKEVKAPVAKATKGRKPKVTDKKPKVSKEDVPKRKRGRPRNDEKLKNQEKLKDPKPKGTPGRKRKLPLNVVIKTEKEDTPSPPKKPKESNHNMNGNSKVPLGLQKPKETQLPFQNHTVANNINSNGVFFQFQKGVDVNNAKKPSTSSAAAPKSVTFQPTDDVFNSNSLPKPPKNLPNKGIKGILKNDAANNNNHQTPLQILPKDIKVEKGLLAPFRSPVKLHPQRMASLDAMAKMHVICIPDRKPVEHHSKSTTSVVSTVCAATPPFTHQKSLTQCHERIQFDLKKEGKGSIVHKQIVKEKQQVFVSHSVEQSKTISTKKKANPAPKPPKETKTNKAAASKSPTFPTKGGEKKKPNKVPKGKELDKKCATKSQGKLAATTKVTKKTAKDQPVAKAVTTTKKGGKQTKSEVKVKETIRMQKTCTYQSVTTVNSHGTTNSSVVPVSHVGLTTNYSKTKKTVVTDEECKNKINYSSGSVVNNSYCVTSESPCSIGHHADCCKFHAQPQIIPFAHVQAACGLNRTAESSSPCDGNFAVHRFRHQPTVIYSPPSPDYSCCCSSPLVQHDPCLIRKSLLTYPHHNFNPPSCCCDHSTTQYLCDPPNTSPSYKTPLTCEPSPLDLSLASSSSSVESSDLQQQHCSSPLCCSTRKVLLLRASSGGFQNFQATPSYRFVSSSQGGSTSSSAAAAAAAAAAKTAAEQLAALSPGASNRGQLVAAKREKQLQQIQQQPLTPATTPVKHKGRQFAHGWSWKGKPREKLIALTNDSVPCPRVCYPSVEHKEGDVIAEKDCVLLRSGPKDTDLPYVAKVDTFWENPEDGEMMMSLLWYYRPEHTELGRKQGQTEDEVFASRHRDVNSIACIEDKCYVLTYNEYCRYRAKQTMEEDTTSMAARLVPDLPEGYSRRFRLPKEVAATDIIFFCRHVYDFRQKRILKNPT